ncbi:MAG: hypothetical protein ABI682_08565 [Acidobacteriota bacterium]
MELLYFLAGIVVAVAAVLALKHLRLAKEALETTKTEIKTRFKRDALILSAQQNEVFADKIIPLQAEWATAVKTATGREPISWELKNFDFNEGSFADPNAIAAWRANAAFKDNTRLVIRVLNQMEAFAAYFITGAADEEQAFPNIAKAFCDFVRQFSPYLTLLRKRAGNESGHFPNLVALYQLWSDRAKRMNLESQAKAMGPPPSGIPPLSP